jgi:hypothetical protein
VDELKRKLREKQASEARLMAASRDRSRDDSHAQSQIDQLIGMVSTLAARQQPGSVHIASSTATAPPVGAYSRSVGDVVDYSEYAGMKAGETHEIFEATMSAVAVKKRGDTQFATAHSAWRRLLRMYPVSERVQHQLIGYAFAGTAKASFLKISSEPKHADTTPEALWKVMAKQLYNDTMVRSQLVLSSTLERRSTICRSVCRTSPSLCRSWRARPAMRSCSNVSLTRCQKSCRCTRTASAEIMTTWSRR